MALLDNNGESEFPFSIYKKLIILIFLVGTIISCNSQRNVEQEIQDEIARFYKVVEVKNYEPISYSEFYRVPSTEILYMEHKLLGIDAIIDKGYKPISYAEITEELASKPNIPILGYMLHTLRGDSNYGDSNRYIHTFLIYVYNDMVSIMTQDFKE